MKPAGLQKLPIKIEYASLVELISRANYSIGQLASLFRYLPNPDLLIAPLLIKEATLSSRIEGTQSSIADVYLFEAGEKIPHEDAKEIVNYRKAMEYGRETLQKKPLHLNMIKRLHFILMEGVRGADKARGDFRRVQNWIGAPGAPIDEATYVPLPPQKVMEYMDNLEKYIHAEEPDVLAQAGLIHLQFESIHPFIDGNGRLGRMLIPLFLYEKEMLPYPSFYISEFFESRRQEYYRYLDEGRHGDGLQGWLGYFLEGVRWESEKIQATIGQMLDLYNEIKENLHSSKSPNAIRMLDFLFKRPVFTSREVVADLGLNKVTVSRLMAMFVDLQVLEESERKRNRIFTFRRLLEIVQS